MGTAAAIGLTFAGFYVLQDTRSRLMGYAENAAEVKSYGLHREQPRRNVQEDKRFPVATRPASYVVKPEPGLIIMIETLCVYISSNELNLKRDVYWRNGWSYNS